ncbi:hypothetical protein VN97_g5303 [Penicillium thymicola]|uniref:Uncharacterized protein n=1 Tax=Penicillium thymicola TaxID=293382 RepID=A0AAI9TIW8_PENTH|nr:hypothetical protein VN97_g5303 [Penicillium thymicola]
MSVLQTTHHSTVSRISNISSFPATRSKPHGMYTHLPCQFPRTHTAYTGFINHPNNHILIYEASSFT